MTRYKYLRRLERAIDNSHRDDLEWAASWCQQRLAAATMKHHQNHWRKLARRVDDALEQLRD